MDAYLRLLAAALLIAALSASPVVAEQAKPDAQPTPDSQMDKLRKAPLFPRKGVKGLTCPFFGPCGKCDCPDQPPTLKPDEPKGKGPATK
ncbi:MAG: hypothetical protein AB7E70_02975 [Hyphomicrobiaceae bacterium]